MLIGILRPAIVVPGETLRKLSPPELAMVLGHELAHIRRGDLLWNLAAAGVRTVFFFHPLVWLSQKRLNLAQEVAADELVILREHDDPVSYGNLLVSVVGKLGSSRLIPSMSMGTAGTVKSLTRRLVAMKRIGRASRGIIVTSGILLAATVLLGIVPWRLVAAEPKENKEQPLATIKPIPPATPATGPLVLRENQRLAKIKVWERKKGQAKVILDRPQIVFVIGQQANAEVETAESLLAVAVRSLSDNKPIQHVIEAKLIRYPRGKTPVTLMYPKLTLADDETGNVIITRADGSELGMEATISSSGTRTTIGPPAARRAELTPATDQRLPSSAGGEGKITQGVTNPAISAKSPPAQPGNLDEAASVPVETESYSIVVSKHGSRVAAFDKRTGQSKTLNVPESIRVSDAIMGDDAAACTMSGTPITHLIVFNSQIGKWITYRLPSDVRPLTCKNMTPHPEDAIVIVSDHLVCYQLKDRIIAYSPRKDMWGMLNMNAEPAIGDESINVETATEKAVFTAQSGTWVTTRKPEVTRK